MEVRSNTDMWNVGMEMKNKNINSRMTIKMNVILVSAIIVGLVMAFCVISCSINQNSNPKPTPLPEQYNDYKYIDEIKETDKYSVTRYDDADVDPLFYGKDRNCVILGISNRNRGMDSTEPYWHKYLKFDKKGNVIDSLTTHEYFGIKVDGYFLFKDYYISWGVDGNKNKKTYEGIDRLVYARQDIILSELRGADFSYSICPFDSALQDVLSEWYAKSQIVVSNLEEAEHGTSFFRFYFFMDGKWWTLDMVGTDSFDYDKYPDKSSDTNELGYMKKCDMDTWYEVGSFPMAGSETYYFAYFQRENYYKKQNPSFPNILGRSGTPAHWEGTGFWNIKLNGETLKIKRGMQEEVVGGAAVLYRTYPFYLFSPEGFNFYIWSEWTPEKTSLYVIKQK